MINLKTKIMIDTHIAKKFTLLFAAIGVFIILFLNTLVKDSDYSKYEIYIFGLLYMLLTITIFHFIINFMQNIVLEIDEEYKSLKDEEKDRLVPYKFALDKSVDAIHWLDMNGKFIYTNDSTCKLDGYTKEEFKSMYLEDVDINFTRETAPQCMQEIKNTPNWQIESTHRKKDGTIYPIEVSGHCITHGGKEYICAFVRDMTQRMKYRKQMANMNENLQKSILEKEILIKEIHHRVKNNMEIISSLLSMQARRTDNEKMKYTLIESMSRIQTMALVHEFLYLGKSLAKIDFHAYISRLINDIRELYITQNTKLNIDLHVDKLHLSTDRCIQLGMVLHEICVNSMKYAFNEDRDNLLCIHIKLNDNLVTIKIRDNGEGIKDINAFHKSDSIGMQLIHTIVENQLNGKIDFVNNDGLECTIEFLREESHYE